MTARTVPSFAGLFFAGSRGSVEQASGARGKLRNAEGPGRPVGIPAADRPMPAQRPACGPPMGLGAAGARALLSGLLQPDPPRIPCYLAALAATLSERREPRDAPVSTHEGDRPMSTSPKPPQIISCLFYSDVPAALDFLTRAFGLEEQMRTGTPSGGMHGEASFQDQLIMMGQRRARTGSQDAAGSRRRDDGRLHLSATSTNITRQPRRRARKSCIRRRMSTMPEPTRRSIPRAIPGFSPRRRRRGRRAC